MDIFQMIEEEVKAGLIPPAPARQAESFYRSYLAWRESENLPVSHLAPIFKTYWDLIRAQVNNPVDFAPYHRAIREPFDYYRFGTDIIRGIIDEKASAAFHLENVDMIEQRVAAGENVILLANHQTEPDPQIFSILLEKSHPRLAVDKIFVAGGRVLTDPLAVPFSLGCNLLCVYSKRHIDHPPEQRAEKFAHNTRTMKVLFQLLEEGGQVIYIAPSGGRDRPDENGVVSPARFDPKAVEMFRLVASRAQRPCHFVPLALYSHDVLPPPAKVQTELGEDRYTRGGAVYMSFGPELDFDRFPGADQLDRAGKREARADHAWQEVVRLYREFPISHVEGNG